MKKKVLILGSTGRVGDSFIEEYLKNYRDKYELIIGYHRKKPRDDLKKRKYHLKSCASLRKVFKGVDVVIHLAANSNEKADFRDTIEPNILGAYNVFEAARDAKVERVIFASSVHAIRGYPVDYEVKQEDIPKPSGFYGASKIFGESLCYIYSNNYNMSCLAIRIGAYTPDDKKELVCVNRQDYHYLITQKDFAQLIYKCVVASESVKFAILPGISNNRKKNMDLKFAKKLIGYEPEDDAYEICEEVRKK